MISVEERIKNIKKKVSKIYCNLNLHKWVIVAKARKDGKEITMKKCVNCHKKR